ncbi:MAG: DUF4091 domain-containing protein [Deltaproteobacteria bacterium]|nr:DUF4091 domain-containing protein [Deltaproteobacteria bacterium]
MIRHPWFVPLALVAGGLAGGPAACGGDDGAADDGGVPDVRDDGGVPDGPPGEIGLWVEHVAHKVQPTTVPGTAAAIELATTRRSWAAAQLVVRAEAGVLRGVDLAATDLDDGAGHAIAASNVVFFRQRFIDYTGVSESEPGNVPVPDESPTADPLLPDPLVPFVDPYSGAPAGAPFDVAADRNQPVWVDVFVPEDTLAGTYTGTIRVTAEGLVGASVPLTVEVWDLVLPDMQSVPTWFGAHVEEVIHYHAGTSACSGSSCWIDWTARSREVVKRYEELAHAHRIDTGQHFVPDPEGPGACGVPTDWSAYDAAVEPYMDGSYFADGVPSTRLDVPFSPGVDWGYEGSCDQAGYTALAAAWAAHLEERGWMSRAIAYAYDEPPDSVYPDIARHSGWLQDGDPDWKAHVLVTSSPTPAGAPILDPAVGIYCVCLRCYDGWVLADDYGRAEWPALFAAGIRLWFYESNAQSDPYPTFAANTLWGAEPLIALWGSWFERASGFLLWDVMAWDRDDPWGPNVGYGKTGDGVLLYPGHHDGLAAPAGSPPEVALDGPIPSYRLKMVRAGLQDWALFRLAEDRGLGELARTEVARVYGQLGGCEWSGCPPPENGSYFWNHDATRIDQVRRTLAEALVAAGGG